MNILKTVLTLVMTLDTGLQLIDQAELPLQIHHDDL